MLELASKESEIFTGADPYQVSDYVKQHVSEHRIIISRDSAENAYLHHKDFEGLAISKLSYGRPVHVIAPKLADNYQIQIITAGHCLIKRQGQEIQLKVGQFFLFNPVDEVDLYYSEDCEKVIVRIPQNLINNAAVDCSNIVPGAGVCFAPKVGEIVENLSLLRFLELVCLEADSPTTSQKLCAPYNKLLATKMLCTFPSNLVLGGDDVQLPKHFSQLINHIEDNIKDYISLEGLALLNKVSLRTIYNNFSHYKNCSPMHYIKHRKLMHVRTELLSATSSGRNVTEIALDYGFFHLGRFSSDYKKLFSELPSETLKRR